jgi:hypothetical protein
MYKHGLAVISFLFVSLVLFSAVGGRAQEAPEIDRIIREVSIDNQKGAILNYTYFMKFSYERHRKLAGRKFTRLYEAILPSKIPTNKIYTHQILLLEDSEKRLTREDVRIARENLARELEKDEREAERQPMEKPNFEDGGYWTTSFQSGGQQIKVDIIKLMQNSTFSNLQRREINGRNIVTIDFAVKKDAVLDRTLLYLSKIEGQMTIDETDKRVIRVEGFAPGEYAAMKEKSEAERQNEMVFLFTQTKVFEGYWFPQTIWLNFGKHPEIFEPIEIQYNFSGYKKASVDVKDSIDTPKNSNEAPSTEKKQN